MSSNNTSNIVGVRDMANGSGGGDYESSSLRKAKKQRIPKRGPGVAELEKILREQEQKDGHTSSSLVPSLPNFYPSLPRSGNNGPGKGVYINGSGVYLPEQTLLPISWGSSEEPAPKMAADFSFPMPLSNGSGHTMLQRNHLSMMMSAKRSRPNVPVENWPAAAPSRMSFQQPIRPQVSRLDPSSSSTNNGVFSLGISGKTMKGVYCKNRHQNLRYYQCITRVSLASYYNQLKRCKGVVLQLKLHFV
ncbi:hypothetical protein GOBAR_DD24629 [Gossypium barbadense]|nr:hypothetical protein GOBAR_DD24629 [Gossypium barbadense]